MNLKTLSVALLLASGSGFAANEILSNAADRQSLAVAIYNDGLALIRESRQLNLAEGENQIALRDVSGMIMSETVSLKAGDADVQLLEQNFDYDLLSEASLLDKYVGKEVKVISRRANGEESSEKATLLAYNDGSIVLQYADRIETGLAENARLAFAELPANLRDRPTLNLRLQSATAGEQKVDVAYLSTGLRWQADYVANLSADEKTLDLAGWVTLNNQSGTRYENAQLQLIAGDVNRAPPEVLRRAYATEAMMMAATPAAAQMSEEALFEYHLYTLNRPTTIENNQSKQVALLSGNQIPVRKEYRLQGSDYWYYRAVENAELGEERKVAVYVEFDNKEEAQLGLPLPKGVVRVYKSDSQDRALFIGEDRIAHIAKNEIVRLKLGDAFDVKGVWKHLSTEPVSSAQLVGKLLGGKGKAYDIKVSISLSNAKEEAVSVKIVEPIPGFWEMQSESHPHQKVGAQLAQWSVPVPAEGKAELNYTVRVRFD